MSLYYARLNRLAPVCIGAAARACFLRIAARVFDEPRGGFQKPEVGIDGRRYGCQQNREGNEESCRWFHKNAPLMRVYPAGWDLEMPRVELEALIEQISGARLGVRA